MNTIWVFFRATLIVLFNQSLFMNDKVVGIISEKITIEEIISDLAGISPSHIFKQSQWIKTFSFWVKLNQLNSIQN